MRSGKSFFFPSRAASRPFFWCDGNVGRKKVSKPSMPAKEVLDYSLSFRLRWNNDRGLRGTGIGGYAHGSNQATEGSAGLLGHLRDQARLRTELRGNRQGHEADLAGDGSQAHYHAGEERLYSPRLQPEPLHRNPAIAEIGEGPGD